jgi:hypothetical protein
MRDERVGVEVRRVVEVPGEAIAGGGDAGEHRRRFIGRRRWRLAERGRLQGRDGDERQR